MERIVTEGKHGHYDYQVWAYNDDSSPEKIYYNYNIINKDANQHFFTDCQVIKASNEGFYSPGEAVIAAIDYIDSLEEGEY